jgi:membrane protein
LAIRPLRVLKEAAAEWSQDNATRLAAALAYYALFSIAPLLLIAISVAGLVFGREAAEGEIFRQLHDLVGPQGAAAVQDVVRNANRTDQGVLASVVGLVLILFGASGVMGELKSALNTIWDIPPRAHSNVWTMIRDRFFSLTMVLAVGFLLMVSLVVSAVVSALGRYLEVYFAGSEVMLQSLNFVASLAVITLLFMLIFRYVPDTRIAWRHALPGAAATALLFTIGKFVIGLYLGKSSFTSTYGAAGSLVVFLAWVYYSAQILFFGAELTQVYVNEYGSRILPLDAETYGPMPPGERRIAERRGRERRRPTIEEVKAT